jgi:excisionase family DNA binding protein
MRYLTVQEAAAVLRVSQQTVRRWAKTGVIKSLRLGDVTRIPESAVRIQESDRGAVSLPSEPGVG